MSSAQSTTISAEARFWEWFVERSRRNGVKEHAFRWHVGRAEESMKALPDKRLRQHTRSDVTGYLEQAGRLGRIADWHFGQIVDAIQNLLATAGLDHDPFQSPSRQDARTQCQDVKR